MSPDRQEAGSIARVVALWQAGDAEAARQMCEVLASVQGDAESLGLLAEILTAAGRIDDAARSLERLAQLRPADAAVLRRLGDAQLAGKAYVAAAASYRESLRIDPLSARGHNNLGQALMLAGDLGAAAFSYERALEINPSYAIASNNLGIVLHERGAYETAVARYRCALELVPGFAEAAFNCGNSLQRLNRHQDALDCYERALTIRPAACETLVARGIVLWRLERHADALVSFEQALKLQSGHAEALNGCATSLLSLKRPEEALNCCQQAIAAKPEMPESYSNLGGALRMLNRYEEAYAACNRALQMRSGYALAYSNLANIMLALDRHDEALRYCDQAIAMGPDLPEAYNQRAEALLALKRPAEAVHAYERLLRLHPGRRYLLGAMQHARMNACDWSGYDEALRTLVSAALESSRVVAPFTLLAVSDSPALHRRCAQDFADYEVPQGWRQNWSGAIQTDGRIRVAYLSADYHEHATAMLAAGLFERHDRRLFEVFAVSFGPEAEGPMRRRLEHGFDRFIDVRCESDSDVAQMLRSLEVDIAVDLKGYTSGSRPGILARRPAPIQVNYLGYPGSMGLAQIDYIVADHTVLPPEQAADYQEKIVWLPECYQVNDDRRVIATDTPSRGEAGLPDNGFVFCCFNNNYKITPRVFSIWMRLLQQTPGSVLWLLGDNADAVRNLRLAALQHGVDAERLVFAPRVPAAEHLARHRLADLFLDTLPYNAHTTGSDALWAGLPVLTCLGSAFPGRVAASLLQAVGLPELITHSLDEYCALALKLVGDPGRLARLRDRLVLRRAEHPLFDTSRYCRHLEAAYLHMHRRRLQGQPAESFAIPAAPLQEQLLSQGRNRPTAN